LFTLPEISVNGTPQDLLLVEDNPGDARLIKELLIDELGPDGFHIRYAESLAEALEHIAQRQPEVVILDLSLPDSFGLDTLYRIQSQWAALPVIVLTGNEDQEVALMAVKAGAQDYLIKHDLSGRLLIKTIQYARERKHNEAVLRVSEARFRSLAELSSDWYWEQDATHRLKYLSEGLQEKSGVDPQALRGRRWWELAQASTGADWSVLQGSLDARQPFQDFVFRYGDAAEAALHISISGVPVFEDAVFAGYRGLGKDVSARERAAASLRHSEERFRRMMDTGRDGILMLAADGSITFCNRQAASMLGADEAAVRGKKLDSFLRSGRLDGDRRGVGPQGQHGIALARADGTVMFAMEARYPVTNPDGSESGTLAILTDIGEYQHREERVRELAALAAQKSEAERANTAKSRFLAAVSHDLRQPMHAMGLFIDDLKSTALPSEAAGLVRHMQSALHSTQALLDAILIMSRLESGMIAPNIMAFPIEPLLGRVRTAFSATARQKNLRFVVASSALTVMSDPTLLERMLSNLVSNALRYTHAGGVLVACRRRGDSLLLEVWDTGVGIPEEHREAVFREFFRIERERDPRGVGLGLAIVKSCSQLLGYSVDLRSIPGKGSRFSFRVPIRPAANLQFEPVQFEADVMPADESEHVRFDGLHVLLVDDDELILAGTRKLLERWGCQVISATSGPQAEALLDREPVGPDLVISDLRLDAGELGVDIIARVRGRYRPNLPAVLISGDTSVQTARFVRRHGLPLLYKPVPPGRLRAFITSLRDG
jgi:PAS domain S-box-containing protein